MEKLNIQLTLDEINLILFSLGELPAKQSMTLIQEIHNQYNIITTEEKKS